VSPTQPIRTLLPRPPTSVSIPCVAVRASRDGSPVYGGGLPQLVAHMIEGFQEVSRLGGPEAPSCGRGTVPPDLCGNPIEFTNPGPPRIPGKRVRKVSGGNPSGSDLLIQAFVKDPFQTRRPAVGANLNSIPYRKQHLSGRNLMGRGQVN
jgi:hypothetical protein